MLTVNSRITERNIFFFMPTPKLKKLYKIKTTYEIGELVGVSNVTVIKWLKESDMPIKPVVSNKEWQKRKNELDSYIKKHPEVSQTELYSLGHFAATLHKFYDARLSKAKQEIMGEVRIKYGGISSEEWQKRKSELDNLIKKQPGISMRELSKKGFESTLRKFYGSLTETKRVLLGEEYIFGVTNQSQYRSFLEKDKTARKLTALVASANGLSGAVLDRLVQLYPHQLKKSKEKIPKWIESLGGYLGPFTMALGRNVTPTIDVLLTNLPEQILDENFQEILFTIARDSYMPRFNKSPKRTMKSLESKIKKEKEPYVKELMKQVHDYYQDVYNLEIPGIEMLGK